MEEETSLPDPSQAHVRRGMADDGRVHMYGGLSSGGGAACSVKLMLSLLYSVGCQPGNLSKASGSIW